MADADVLKREIQNEAEQEAEAILNMAKTESDEKLEEARLQAESILKEYQRSARGRAADIEKRILSGVHLDLKRQAMKNREAVLGQLFAEASKKIEAFRRQPEYRDVLRALICEGVDALTGEELMVCAGEPEQKILTHQLADIETKYKAEGRTLRLILDPETLNEGGVIVRSPDHRVRLDNRFSARLKRMNADLRLSAMKQLEIDYV